MADINVDAPPPKTIKDDEEEEEIFEEQEWKEYFRPANVTLLIHRNFKLFTLLVGLYYIIHFCMCAGATDAYSDITRMNICK